MIRLAVLMSVRFPLSLRNIEDLLFERSIDLSHETIRFWWNRFGPMFAGEVRQRTVEVTRSCRIAEAQAFASNAGGGNVG